MSTEPVPVPMPLLPAAERGREQARGYSAGYAAGMHAAAQRAAAEESRLKESRRRAEERDAQLRSLALSALVAADTAVRARADDLAADVELEIVRYSIALAEALVGWELSDADAAARSALARVRNSVPAGSVVTVRMHPDDVALVAAEAAEHGIRITADAGLLPGDAVADLDEGWLDARLSTAVSRVTAMLAGTAEAES